MWLQINSMGTSDSEGPAWQKFWMSMDQGDTESIMSGEDSRAPHTPDHRSGMISPELHRPDMADRLDSLMPGDSASHHGAHDIDEHSAFIGAAEDTPFTFKFKAPNGRVHRLAVTASAGLQDLITVIADKLGTEADSLGGVPAFEDGKLGHAGFALSYLDNEGDTVSITTDHDLYEAISLARTARRDKVDLFVHDPAKAAIPPTTEPAPQLAVPPTPPESQIKQRKRFEEDEEVLSPSSERRRERKAAPAQDAKQQDQVVPGVPNELLLPGALVVLGAVIVITFAVGRASSSR